MTCLCAEKRHGPGTIPILVQLKLRNRKWMETQLLQIVTPLLDEHVQDVLLGQAVFAALQFPQSENSTEAAAIGKKAARLTMAIVARATDVQTIRVANRITMNSTPFELH